MSYAPAPMPDIFAPMSGAPSSVANPSVASPSVAKVVESASVDRAPMPDNSLDNLLPDEDEIDNKPAYLRRNSSKRNFLDI